MRLSVRPACGERFHLAFRDSRKRLSPSAASAVVVPLVAALALLLQGCGTRRACKISDIYGLIQVDGRTGLTKHELDRAGVKLCARHLRKEETYSNDACGDPGEVFADGELPTLANGDSNALLLVRCPSNAYPKGKELQRVTCSDDFMGESEEGLVQKALHLRFDNYERASNCLLGGNMTLEWDNVNETAPAQVMTHVNQSFHGQGKATTPQMPAAGKVMRHADHVTIFGPGGSSEAGQVPGAELLVAAAAAAASSGEDQAAAALARELGPALLSKPEAEVLLGKTDVSIHPHGTFSVHDKESEHHHWHDHTPVRPAMLRSDVNDGPDAK